MINDHTIYIHFAINHTLSLSLFLFRCSKIQKFNPMIATIASRSKWFQVSYGVCIGWNMERRAVDFYVAINGGKTATTTAYSNEWISAMQFCISIFFPRSNGILFIYFRRERIWAAMLSIWRIIRRSWIDSSKTNYFDFIFSFIFFSLISCPHCLSYSPCTLSFWKAIIVFVYFLFISFHWNVTSLTTKLSSLARTLNKHLATGECRAVCVCVCVSGRPKKE